MLGRGVRVGGLGGRWTACVAFVALFVAPAATAAITPVDTTAGGAGQIATAIDTPSADVTGASYAYVPPSPLTPPNAIADAPIGAFFPSAGPTFAILTNGDARFADDPNTNVPDEPLGGPLDDLGSDLNGGFGDDGPTPRGATAYDVSIVKIDFVAPQTANCLSFDFAFFSEEYADYVGQTFNDAFVAELDSSTWSTTASAISAPNNFAFDQNGDVISVNSTGVGGMSLANASGTTYDGATQLLSASKQVSPGPHSLYLSIFDQGDQVVDSAAFVDNLRVGYVPSPQLNCVAGAQPVVYALALDQQPGPTATGSSHTVTATLTDAITGAPLANETIDFTVAGANLGARSLTTDASGQAVFQYVGSAVGDDAISACLDVDDDSTCEAVDSVAHSWFLADTAPPDTTITSGPDNVTSRDRTPTFEFVSDDPAASFECRLNGSEFSACTTPFTRELDDGFYDFEVRAVDPAGNVDPTPALRHFEIFTGRCAGQKIDIFVNPGQTVVKGTKRPDVILGSPQRDVVKSGSGNDVVCDREGNDVLKGGAGNDKLRGGPGDDKIIGEAGEDLLSGRSGNDKLLGGKGADFLNGNPGNDLVNGGPDDDVCQGGSGRNRFVGCE